MPTETGTPSPEPVWSSVDRSLAHDEDGKPCRCCISDSGSCRCVGFCGALACTGDADD